MATRTLVFPGGSDQLDSPSHAGVHAGHAGGWIADDVSTTQQVTSGTTELTIHTVSAPVGASRRLRVTLHMPGLTGSVANDEFNIRLYYDGTAFKRFRVVRASTAEATGAEFSGFVATTTAGDKTIHATAHRGAGTGTLTIVRSATNALSGFLLVEDIGPSA